MNWQPIYTAPKDGRKLLLWSKCNEYMTDCRWNIRGEYWEEWTTDAFDGWGWCRVIYDPTHWIEVTRPKES